MRLFDPATVRAHLGLPPDADEDEAIRRGEYPRHTDWLEAARRWAEEFFPAASALDQCSYAALVESFTTGYYGGYGTEAYDKEQQIRDIILAFAGAMPAPRDSVIAITPPLDDHGEPILPFPAAEWTRAALDLMTTAYFEREPRRALDDAAAIVNRIPGAPSTLEPVRQGLLRVIRKYYRRQDAVQP